jgi:hypothetical protein
MSHHQDEDEASMPAIVQFPTVVDEALKTYGDFFRNQPERQHLGEYLTGLMVASRKSVRGINSEFADTTDQSCLNRWLVDVDWDAQALNERRLKELQKDRTTRYSPSRGIIPIDNVLIDHEGKTIEDVGWFWDHADQRHLIAHDYIIANYVCPSGKHYPLEFRRFQKKDQVPKEEFKDHNQLARELVDWVCQRQIPGDFTFDSYFTNALNLNHIQAKGRAYVGDLKFNRKLVFKGQEIKASEVAHQLPPEERKEIVIGGKSQYYFTHTVRIPAVDHPVRLVILWKRPQDQEPTKVLVTNRTYWEITRVLMVYRHRWTGTETFHRDGKQHLGMGDCQVRKGQGQTRHMYLVFLAYSLLMGQLKQGHAQEWAFVKLTTIGEACRAVMRETLAKTLSWAIDRAIKHQWSTPRICHALGLAA